ncbi:MAG: PilN domain-containing protein [Myxococcota bacterium]
MIRVNLLPNASERRTATAPAEASQAWLLVVMLAVVVEIVVLFFVHQSKQDELDDVNAEVQKVSSQVSDIQSRVKDHKDIKRQLEVLRAREDAIAKLQSARRGPTAVLLELGRVLTAGKGPTVDPDKLEAQKQSRPGQVFNPAWDPKRVWLTNYTESNRNVRLEGLARDGGDVYEFAQRLKLSQYFEDVRLLPGKQRDRKGPGAADGPELVTFALQVKVNY